MNSYKIITFYLLVQYGVFAHHPNRRMRGINIMSHPDVQQCDFKEHPETHLSVATQTCMEKADACVQTDPMDTRIVSYDKCKSFKRFQFFTGLTEKDFEALYDLIGGEEVVRHLKLFYKLGTPKKVLKSNLSGKDRLFMFLLRLRRGLPLKELSFIFNLSDSYVGEICYAMTRVVYLTFKSMERILFVSAADQNKEKPMVMKPFKNLRVILDGASFYIQKPSNFEQQGNTFSQYEKWNVVLFNVGISCKGDTIYCSPGYEGNMSDKEMVIQSGLLDLLHEGDAVMTDRGYDLKAELQRKGCFHYKPPTLGDREFLTPEEEILTKAIASARIYVEHAIADIKDNRLIQGVIPITLLPVINDLVFIAAYLRNFKHSRVVKKTSIEAKTKKGCSSNQSVDYTCHIENLGEDDYEDIDEDEDSDWEDITDEANEDLFS